MYTCGGVNTNGKTCSRQSTNKDFFCHQHLDQRHVVCIPYAMITHGPTGSGKSGLVKKTIDHYGLPVTHEKFLIDDIVEQNVHYKSAIDNLIIEECKSNTLCESLQKRLLDPGEELYTKFGSLYMQYRGKTGEKWCDDKKETCSNVLNSMLNRAIERKVNIVFETVGTYYVDWLVSKLTGYETFFTFTMLDFCDNVRRNKTRALTSTRTYVGDRINNPAPRLPDVRESVFKKSVISVSNTLWDLMGKKLFGRLPDVHHIVVFDNTNRDIVVLYDSDTSTSMTDLVEKIQSIKHTLNIRTCSMR
jgi:hypothetical protein